MLTFYNAIANDGKMVQPQLYKGTMEVINPQIASKANIGNIKEALIEHTEGLDKTSYSESVIAGKQGFIELSIGDNETEFALEFCGYFPVDNPQYSIIVSINKMGLPVDGDLIASDVCKQIVDNVLSNISEQELLNGLEWFKNEILFAFNILEK